MKSILISCVFLLSITKIYSSDQTIKVEVRNSDRVFIFNFLTNLFGPDSKNILIKNILSKPHFFKGPCDPYSEVSKKGKKNEIIYENEINRCYGGISSSKLPFFGKFSTMGSAYMKTTCNALITKDNTRKYFLKKVLGNKNIKNITNDDLQLLWNSFYSYVPISKKWLEESKSTKNISNIIFSLCISKYWQVM
jgi:hypothetical protein